MNHRDLPETCCPVVEEIFPLLFHSLLNFFLVVVVSQATMALLAAPSPSQTSFHPDFNKEVVSVVFLVQSLSSYIYDSRVIVYQPGLV